MADKKRSYFISLGTTHALKLQLDPDIYTSDVQTATGLTATEPANTIKIIPTNRRYAILADGVSEVKLRASKGAVGEEIYRPLVLLVEDSKAATVKAALSTKKIRLGNGAGVEWTIV